MRWTRTLGQSALAAEHEMPPPSKDPSQLKGVVGSTDQAANKDVARGSGFAVGGGEGCHFKAGDHVRVEASDVGTITTIKALDQTSSGSRIAGERRRSVVDKIT